MKPAILLTIIFMLIFPSTPNASINNSVKAAFIREGNVWTLADGKETQITNTGNIHSVPKWSTDGTMIAYQMDSTTQGQSELWTYNLNTREKKKISYNGDRKSVV